MARQWVTWDSAAIDEDGTEEYVTWGSAAFTEDQAAVTVVSTLKRIAATPDLGYEAGYKTIEM